MTPLNSLGLRFDSSRMRLMILDQRKLPDREEWIEVHDADKMCELIKSLAVRGAPLIGVAAACALVVEADAIARYTTLTDSAKREALTRSWRNLRDARPTAVNLMWAMDRLRPLCDSLGEEGFVEHFVTEATAVFNEDVAMCEQMGKYGATLIQDGDSVMTICNTGGLATVGMGTAFAALQTAHESGKRIHVYACETRPLLQGGRLTTWELAKCGIPHTLVTDSMAAGLMRDGKVKSVFTGADRVSARGDFANKIGTYSLAVLAKYHGVQFYPVAPMSTVDRKTADGAAIEIEQRSADEVRGFLSPHSPVRWAPAGVSVYNPSFDVTPAELITKIVLNDGVYSPEEYRAKLREN